MSTDIKLSKTNSLKCSFRWFIGKTSGNLGKKGLLDLTVPLADDILPKLANKATLSILDKVLRKISGKRVLRVRMTIWIILLES